MITSTTSFSAAVPQQAGHGPLPRRNEPKSARKPLRRPQTPRIATASPEPEPDPDRDRDRHYPPVSTDKDTRSLVKAFSTLSSLTTLTDSDAEKKTPVVDDDDDPAPTSTAAPKTPLRPSRNPRLRKRLGHRKRRWPLLNRRSAQRMQNLCLTNSIEACSLAGSQLRRAWYGVIVF